MSIVDRLISVKSICQIEEFTRYDKEFKILIKMFRFWIENVIFEEVTFNIFQLLWSRQTALLLEKVFLSPSFKFFAIFICQFMTNKMPGIKAQLSMQTKIENVSQQLRSSFSQLHNSHFFQNCCHFCWNQNKVCENDNTFERNEDCASVFLKLTSFSCTVFWILFFSCQL